MKDFLNGFRYAAEGILAAVRRERNMRFHLVTAAYLAFFLTRFRYFSLTRTQIAILFLACALVIGLELLNTAIEEALDAVNTKQHPLIKLAKDASAGAVLVAGIGAAGAGAALLYQPAAFRALYGYYRAHPGMLMLLALSILAALWFIFCFGDKKAKSPGHGNGSMKQKEK